jgi:hypothetical protein
MTGYLIDARDKPGLLVAFMKEFASNARITFEGNLSKCDFSAFPTAAFEPDGAFKRNTTIPRHDYIVLPLSDETIKPIMAQVLPKGRCVHDIIHIEIEKKGELVLSACDNFHPECTWTPLSAEPILRRLKEKQVIRSYRIWHENEDVQKDAAADADKPCR